MKLLDCNLKQLRNGSILLRSVSFRECVETPVEYRPTNDDLLRRAESWKLLSSESSLKNVSSVSCVDRFVARRYGNERWLFFLKKRIVYL